MRSFAGRDILSLNGFERAEFEHVFEVCDELEPIARKRENVDLLKVAGFRHVEMFFRWYNFCGIVAVKGTDAEGRMA